MMSENMVQILFSILTRTLITSINTQKSIVFLNAGHNPSSKKP